LESKDTILKEAQRELGREQAAGKMTQQINDVMEILKVEEEEQLLSSTTPRPRPRLALKSDQPGELAENSSVQMQNRLGKLESDLTMKDLLKNTCEEIESHNESASGLGSWSGSLDFRVLRRVGDESLLVSWTIPEFPKGIVEGYEISVNGNIFLRIRHPNRCKALLFGLDMSDPLALSLKCTGANMSVESCITYIA
jgi:hypothetical protein